MEKKLIDIVEKYLKENIDESNKNSSLRSLGLDSMATIELLIAIETEFDIQIPDRMLVPATFESFNKLKDGISIIIGEQ